MISINVIIVNGRDDRQSYGSEDSMTGVIPTATPVPPFVQDSRDLAKALLERGFYVFGRLTTQQADNRGESPAPPTGQDVAEGG